MGRSRRHGAAVRCQLAPLDFPNQVGGRDSAGGAAAHEARRARLLGMKKHSLPVDPSLKGLARRVSIMRWFSSIVFAGQKSTNSLTPENGPLKAKCWLSR